MNHFQQLARSRRSVRKYDLTRSIPENVVERILQAGIDAPTAKNAQPFHLYILRSDEARAKFQSCYNGRWVDDAPLYILVVGEEEEAWVYKDGQNNTVYTDAAIVTTHMMLQAWDDGVGSCWICAFDREKCCELFGLELGKRTPLNVLALGYPLEDPSTLPYRRKPKSELITDL